MQLSEKLLLTINHAKCVLYSAYLPLSNLGELVDKNQPKTVLAFGLHHH